MQGLSKRTSQESGNSSRLLIVDDDAYLRTSLRQQFVAEGFHNIFDVGSATGLNTALKEANPDLILLDIEGLEAGANDYVTKPLRMGELLSRIHTQLRQFKASDDARFELADLNFVPANKMLHKMDGGRMQALTEKETTILKFLYRAFPESVTKDELLTEVWGLQNGLTTHTLETHIYRLRQKIGRLTKTPIVITTENGYRLEL